MTSTLNAARPTTGSPSRPLRRTNAGQAIAWAMLAIVIGASWGLLSIAALRAQRLDLLTVTDSWYAWGAFLVVLALLPGGTWAKGSYVLLGGAASITIYYVLKAYWAVGYPNNERGFVAYFQIGNFAYFMGIVALAAPVLAVAVSLVGRVLNPRR